MRVIFEENIENEDFFEIILREEELEKIALKGLVKLFPTGIHGCRGLNVFIRTEREEIMPLVKGAKAKSKKGFSKNVSTEKHAGKKQSQAVAIAYSEARRGKKK